MKLVYKLISLSFLSMLLFGCNNSLVDENPTKKSSTESSSESSESMTSSSSISESESESESSSSEIDLDKPHKILFIGNSFTFYNDIDQVTEAIGKNLGLTITCEKVATSAYHLSQHASDVDDESTLISQKLKNTNNDYTRIIMQEHSTSPVSNYNSFLQGATDLKAKINQYQPNAKISLYETWGFQSMADSYNKTIPECEQLLFEKYNQCGKALNLDVNYVGRGFTKVYQTYPTINLYYSGDNKHPSFMGTYLASLIHIMSITGVDVRNCTYVGTQGSYNAYGETYVNSENATILKNIAYDVVTQYGTNPNQ